jgi:hypothetical protein
MRSRRWSALRGLVLVATLSAVFVACAYRAAVRQDHLSAYRGDGQISRIEYLPNPGVELTFERFSLAHPFAATYRIDGLPRRPVPYLVDLVVPDPGDEWRVRSGEPIRIGVSGTLSLSAYSGTGEVIFECRWSPEVHGWSMGPEGAAAGYIDHLHKQPRTKETQIYPEAFRGAGADPATLAVAWDPGPGSPDKVAYVRMQSGGTK